MPSASEEVTATPKNQADEAVSATQSGSAAEKPKTGSHGGGHFAKFTAIGVLFAALLSIGHVLGGVAGLIEGYKLTVEAWFPHKKTEAAPKEKALHPTLPDKPSIAVLPFVNVSGDKEQEYFSDGLTDEVINALSKLRNVFVVARNSTFTYKGKNVTVQQVGEEMGVRYVLQGTVRKSGDKVRATAQLADASTGRQIMSERYDRDIKDIFGAQDEITIHVLAAMRVAITEGETARITAKGTKNLDAYLKVMQASELRTIHNPQNHAMGAKLAEEAIVLDPKYAMAYSVLASALTSAAYQGDNKDAKEMLEKARRMGEKAVAIDSSLGFAHSELAWNLVMHREYDKAITEAQRGVDLEPGSANANHMLGVCLSFGGEAERSIPVLKRAMRLSPIPILNTLGQLSNSYRQLGQYEEAIAVAKEATQREPDYQSAHLALAAAYMLIGKESEARAEVAEVLRINPNFSLERYAKSYPAKDPAYVRDRVIEPLRKAGLK
jgi:adenylate cyclase